MKVKDLEVSSKPLDLETNVDILIRDAAQRLTAVRDVPATVELYEANPIGTTEVVFQKRFKFAGELVPKDVHVKKRIIGARLEYLEPRDLVQIPTDFIAIYQASGLNFSDDSFKRAHLDLLALTGQWWMTYFSNPKPWEVQKNTATVRIYAVPTSQEIQELRDVSDNLSVPEYKRGKYHVRDGNGTTSSPFPQTLVGKSWIGQFSESEIFAFYYKILNIDKKNGMTARMLKKSKHNVETAMPPPYRVDLSSGDSSPVVAKIVNPPEYTGFKPQLKLDVLVQGSGYIFRLMY